MGESSPRKAKSGAGGGKGKVKAPPKNILSDAQKKDVLEAFAILDADRAGLIPGKDVVVALRALGNEPSPAEIKSLLSRIDRESSGMVSAEQFLDIFSAKWIEADSEELQLFSFSLYDEDNKGYITKEDLDRVSAMLGKEESGNVLEEMFQEADADKDGRISEEEFLRILQRDVQKKF